MSHFSDQNVNINKAFVTLREIHESDKPLLMPMLQNYLAGFARFNHQEKNQHGEYHYPYLNHYWTDPNRQALLIEKKGIEQNRQILGFAFIRADNDPIKGHQLTELAEFYISHAHRRHGLGSVAAKLIFDTKSLHGSTWRVNVLNDNQSAVTFWHNVISTYNAEFKTENIKNRHQTESTVYQFLTRKSVYFSA